MVTASLAHAQQYPTKPIRVHTAEVGGGSDFTARLISQRLTEQLGQQIVDRKSTRLNSSH
jgi:tripartite-type tricarboxylate transporter receptor subunit TctC